MTAAIGNFQVDRCLVCDGRDWTPVREGSDLCRPNYPKVFELARCLSCGHVMQIPVPDIQELDAAYSVSGDYACYRPAWREKGWPIWKVLRSWTVARRLAWLKRYGRGKELLEVGCGAGDFLLAAHREGWNVRSVEHNGEMVEILRSGFGFDVRVGELVSHLWDHNQFDVITFWNVLEHVLNPLAELTIAASYLRQGGIVLLNIPSREAAERGMRFGNYWTLLDLPRHINFLDKGALSALCQKAGLQLLVYETPFVQSAWCYYMSSWNWAKRHGTPVARWCRFLAMAGAVTLVLPFVAARSWNGYGLESFAVAVKKSRAQ